VRVFAFLEPAMTQTSRPTKEQVREHMERRAQQNAPPPSPERIREELGWRLLPNNERR